MANTALNRTGVALLTNKSGGALVYGDVVILDNTNANGFTTTTTGALSTRGIGVIIEPVGIANNATGLVAISGWCPQINLNTASTMGQFIKTHTVAGQGTPHSSPQVEGDFAVALTASANPPAFLFGAPNAAGLSTSPGGSSGDIQYNNAGAFGGITPGTGVSTWIATPSSANLAAAVTGETGSGALVFGTSPTLVTPALGTPSALVLTNATGLPFAALPVGTKVRIGYSQSSAAANGATTIPYDNTIPQNTEGVEWTNLAVTCTPNASGSKLEIEVSLMLTNGSAVFETTAIFVDTTADAIAATADYIPAATAGCVTAFKHEVTSAGSGSRTYKVRSGGNAAGSSYLNSHPSVGAVFNGVAASYMAVYEIKQ